MRERPPDFEQYATMPQSKLISMYRASYQTVRRWQAEVGVSPKYHKRKAVIQIDPGTDEVIGEYSSLVAAATAVWGCPCSISRVADGRGKLAYGYHWKYKEERNMEQNENPS